MLWLVANISRKRTDFLDELGSCTGPPARSGDFYSDRVGVREFTTLRLSIRERTHERA